MAARLKSSVLRREERGVGSISMGRLIISGMFGGMVFFAMRLIGLSGFMIPAGLIAFIGGLIVTNLKHGLPLWRYWFITLQAWFLMDAATNANNWTAQISQFLDMSADSLTLDTGKLLSAPTAIEEEGTLDEWEIVPDTGQMSGFEVVTDTIQLEVS